MRRLKGKRQQGIGLLLALAFMAVALPLVTGALALASSLSIDSGVKERILKRQYSLLGASQHSFYRLAYEVGYVEGLLTGMADTYTIELNGETITVNVTKVTDGAGAPPNPKSDNARRLQAYKAVIPTAASPGVLTTFAYTITVRNQDDEAEQVTKIHDALPPGFTYVAGSTSGVTTNNPAISTHDDGFGVYKELVWNLAPLHITLQPGEQVMLTFQAQATPVQGNYCNKAWAEPGGELTSTGLTARITVGLPASTLCPGEVATVQKAVQPSIAAGGVQTTFTYTVTLNNIGTQGLSLSKLRDSLPPGFLYVAGSTSGNLTTANPNTTMQQGRQRLDWNFSPEYTLGAGQARTLSFQARAQVAAGYYWNEVWATFDELDYSVYTWPTAMVRVMGVAKTSVTDGEYTADSEVWVEAGDYAVAYWSITR